MKFKTFSSTVRKRPYFRLTPQCQIWAFSVMQFWVSQLTIWWTLLSFWFWWRAARMTQVHISGVLIVYGQILAFWGITVMLLMHDCGPSILLMISEGLWEFLRRWTGKGKWCFLWAFGPLPPHRPSSLFSYHWKYSLGKELDSENTA